MYRVFVACNWDYVKTSQDSIRYYQGQLVAPFTGSLTFVVYDSGLVNLMGEITIPGDMTTNDYRELVTYPNSDCSPAVCVRDSQVAYARTDEFRFIMSYRASGSVLITLDGASSQGSTKVYINSVYSNRIS